MNDHIRSIAALALIANERERQITVEGWTAEHDDAHGAGDLARAAACYSMPPDWRPRSGAPIAWPWDGSFWKPGERIRELAKAGALIVAEIERLQRTSAPSLKVYACDDSDLYAAESAEQAAALYAEMVGDPPEDGYPRELTDEELDAPQPEFDEDERRTGNMTSVRQMLAEHGNEHGWLAGSEW